MRLIPGNQLNRKAKKGIENLLPSALFVDKFYEVKKLEGDYGEPKSIGEFRKMEFCRYVCDERRKAEDFVGFDPVVSILEEFVRGE